MKYLVLLVVLVVAIGIWRSNRAAPKPPQPGKSRPPALPQDMVACAHCGVHVPRADAQIQGNLAYCSLEHQRLGKP